MEVKDTGEIVHNVRIIARLDIKGPKVIKGVHLECLRVVGDPEELATKYYEDGADELIYMDVVASLYGRRNLIDVVEKVSRHIFIPLTVGGGVCTCEDVNSLLRAGADKVTINSGLILNPDFADSAVKSFGSQCIVGSIEAKRTTDGKWEAFYNNGREASGRDVLQWAKELEDRGIGELLITSIDQEGTRNGYDYELISRISSMVDVPVIASGGAGKVEDVEKALFECNTDAATVSALLHYNELSIMDIKAHLSKCRQIADAQNAA